MGNIASLNRSGPGSASLGYSYQGNQLSTVTNNGSPFRSYGYDLNGNATTDGIGHAINYNMLDLPQSLPALNLSYTYTATGEKLKKTSNGSTTDYIAGIQYKSDGTIDFVTTEEGRAIRSGGSYNYEYTLTNHLGNNRATFDQVNGKVGEEDYYPFGLNIHRQTNAGNKYLYNKKEVQEELGQYDYGTRFYDPVIGRMTTVDPMVENHNNYTSYNYVLNNPLKYMDNMGLDTIPANKVDFKKFNTESDVIALNEVKVIAPQNENGANQGGNDNSWFYNNDGTISNYAAGWGYVAGATGNRIGKIIQANSLYGAPLETTFVKTLVGSAEVSTNALRTTGTVLRTAGALAGVAGLGITAYQYANHQILGTEATIDGVFGVIGFIGPWGAAISIGYFGGKYLYEHYSGSTLYEKPAP